ncbi:hypothetical protein CDZ97_07870 [Mameliella alba]|uniref:hypothetical protein n=1 Tax=Mameliella alba TaxID=561184 RepID=UPI000B531023|nr:hypothetical protein [Mameliella alba]OWV65775.1 hypothetical protein CDZ97_07870 [Mameliella alba]
MPKDPACGTTPVLPDVHQLHGYAAKLRDALCILDDLDDGRLPINYITATAKPMATRLMDGLEHLMEVEQ